MPPSLAAIQYPRPVGVAAMATGGAFRDWPAGVPRAGAAPKANTLPGPSSPAAAVTPPAAARAAFTAATAEPGPEPAPVPAPCAAGAVDAAVSSGLDVAYSTNPAKTATTPAMAATSRVGERRI